MRREPAVGMCLLAPSLQVMQDACMARPLAYEMFGKPGAHDIARYSAHVPPPMCVAPGRLSRSMVAATTPMQTNWRAHVRKRSARTI